MSNRPSCTSKPAFYFLHVHVFSHQAGQNLYFILEIYSFRWKRFFGFVTGTGYCFFGNNGTECFYLVAKQTLEKLLKGRFPVVSPGYYGIKRNNGGARGNGQGWTRQNSSINADLLKKLHTYFEPNCPKLLFLLKITGEWMQTRNCDRTWHTMY